MAEKLRELDITKDELSRIGEALKHEEFRKMLVEYCEEITDPANRQKYQEEITELERERGVDVTFINPTSGYVIKTSADGNKIAFINICTNEHVEKPTSQASMENGSRGTHWNLPHLLSPPREDVSKSNKHCTVYDVIFHPDALKHAERSNAFRNFVNNVSCEAVESNHNVNLDKANLKFPKLKYKGIHRPLVIRKKINKQVAKKTENETSVDKMYADMYKQIDEKYSELGSNSTKEIKIQSTTKISPYATPKYLIKHRSDVDIQNFTNCMTSNINAAIPNGLVVEINLPLLKTSADLVLDVTEKTLSLISEKPAKYKLDLTLPYAVNEDTGSAKFDQDQRKLIIVLPVKRDDSQCNLLLSDIGRDDSGVESDNSPLTDGSGICDNLLPLIEEMHIESSENSTSEIGAPSEVYRTRNEASFLNPDLHYLLPEYTCHLFNDVLVFTLNVKNVDPNSVQKVFSDNASAVHIQFSSISPSFVPIYYAFYVYLPSHFIDTENVSVETWDNNVITQISYTPSETKLTNYWVGTSEECTEEKIVEEPSIVFKQHLKRAVKVDSDDDEPEIDVKVTSSEEVSVVLNPEKQSDDSSDNQGSARDETELKTRSYSESSGDELSVSPTKGILKMGRSRTPVSRSVSESSVDDYIWSSFENCASVPDSFIPEESEVSSSMKKTVRFNDVVSRQLFRSNSSILGQKKKNQRKSRNKKRAHDRRLSESENSEVEEKKLGEKSDSDERNVNSAPRDGGSASEVQGNQEEKMKIDFKSDLIFDLDM